MGVGNSNGLVRDFTKSKIGVQKFKWEKLNDGGEIWVIILLFVTLFELLVRK